MRPALPVALGVLLALSACGAGNGPATTSQSRSIGGFAVDGYLADSEIRCLDASGQVIASSRSVSNGAWVLRVRGGAGCQSIEALGGIDIGRGTGDAAERTLLPPGTRFSANIAHIDPNRLGGLALIVSPLTSLVHSLQAQRSMSAGAAKSAILQPLGLSDAIDPLIDNPLAAGNTALFGVGVLAASTVRETTAGILDAIAGTGQPLSPDLRRQVHQRVTDSFAELVRTGALNRQSLGDAQPSPDSPLASLAGESLARLRADSTGAIAAAATAVQADVVRTAVAQYAGSAGASIVTALASADSQQIARRAASLSEASQSDLRRARILAVLTDPGLDLDSVATTVREAIAKPPGETVTLRYLRQGAPVAVELDSQLRDYLKIAGEQLTIFTNATGASGRLISVSDFELGRAQAMPGALSAVAVSFTQPATSSLLSSDSEKTVRLGFRVERADPAGVSSIRLAAIVDGVRIQWSNQGLVLRTPADAVLYGSIRFGATVEDTPVELANTNNRLANLLATEGGTLKIDLAAFLTALNLSPDAVLGAYLGTGALTVEAVISDLVFGRGDGLSLRKLGDAAMTVERGAGKTSLNVTGAGLRGSVTVGQ